MTLAKNLSVQGVESDDEGDVNGNSSHLQSSKDRDKFWKKIAKYYQKNTTSYHHRSVYRESQFREVSSNRTIGSQKSRGPSPVR